MKIEVSECGELELKEIYNVVFLTTEEGNSIGICMRDDTFEFNVIPAEGASKWFRIDIQNLTVEEM